MRSLVTAVAFASLTALTAVGCAAPQESDEVGDATGAATGSVPERTSLFGAGGLVAYFDGGPGKASVTLYRGDAKQKLRCTLDPFGYDESGKTASRVRCHDTPEGSTATDICQVLFTRNTTIVPWGGNQPPSVLDYSMSATCWSAGRTTAKQTQFLKFVLGDVKTITTPNKERTEPTAELTYASGVPLEVKTSTTDHANDPFALTYSITYAVRAALLRGSAAQGFVTPSASGTSVTVQAWLPAGEKKVEVSLLEGTAAAPFPVLAERIRVALGVK